MGVGTLVDVRIMRELLPGGCEGSSAASFPNVPWPKRLTYSTFVSNSWVERWVLAPGFEAAKLPQGQCYQHWPSALLDLPLSSRSQRGSSIPLEVFCVPCHGGATVRHLSSKGFRAPLHACSPCVSTSAPNKLTREGRGDGCRSYAPSWRGWSFLYLGSSGEVLRRTR